MLAIKTLTLAAAAALCTPAFAQTSPAGAPTTPTSASATEQVIVPQVERRDVKRPKYPSNDFAFGLYAGTYATQNFGAAAVSGLRLSYHVTEDIDRKSVV